MRHGRASSVHLSTASQAAKRAVHTALELHLTQQHSHMHVHL